VRCAGTTGPTALRLGLASALALGLSVGTAAAGELAAEFMGGYSVLSASRSADAIFGSSGSFTWGASGRYTITKGFFASAGVRTFSKEGERVFVASPTGPVARLGFPLSIRVTPTFVNAGYRFRDGKMLVPYAGIGGTLTAFREESSVVGELYEKSRTKAGFHVVGGVEVGRGRFRFGAEAGWSTVPDAVGVGGVSAVYDESDLGGWSVLGKFVIAFGGGKKGGSEEIEEPPNVDEPGEGTSRDDTEG
jgi:hypothetical protein